MIDFQDVLVVGVILGVFVFLLISNIGDREKFKTEIENLKAECIAKGVAGYGFDEKGNVVFKIKNGSEVCGFCRPREKGTNAEGEQK